MAEELRTSVRLINQKIQFSGTARMNPAVTIDYIPPPGDGQGYTSLELLLISLGSCSASSVALLPRKMRKTVTGLAVNARKARQDRHPTCFRNISLEFIIESHDATDEDIRKVLQLSEEPICPVRAMLKNNVEIIPEYRMTAKNESKSLILEESRRIP